MTGGRHSGDLDSTEISRGGAWSKVSTGALPSRRAGMRGATLDNNLILTGKQINSLKTQRVALITYEKIS